MKKRFSFAALAALLLSVLLCVGALTAFRPCPVHEDGAMGACFYAGRMASALGALMALISLAVLLLRDAKARAGLFLAMLLNAVLTALTPGVLIALCRHADMRCRVYTQPAVLVLSVLIALAALSGCILSWKNGKK